MKFEKEFIWFIVGFMILLALITGSTEWLNILF